MEKKSAPGAERTRTSEYWLGEDGILHISVIPGVHKTLEDAKEDLEQGRKILGHDRRVPGLVDIRRIQSVSHEARRYYGQKEAAKLFCAQALLVESPLSRVIGNFMLGLNKTLFPIKLFTDEDAALAWLKTFLE
jgi:hypothetical protein